MVANPKMPEPPPKKWYQRIERSGYFVAALFLHLIVFVLISTYVIFPAVQQHRDTDFQAVHLAQPPPPPPPAPPATSGAAALNALEPQATVTPPSSTASLIHLNLPSNLSVNANVNLPNLPASISTPSGSGLTGAGSGTSGNGVGNPFGSASGSDHTLVGTFYDFTTTQDGKDVKPGPYANIVNDFVANHWQPGKAHPCYISPNKIYTNQIFVPNILDEKAGAAFGSPRSSHAFWLIHYQVQISSNRSGKFRLIGFGDNVLIVAIDGTVVLDASDLQFLKKKFSEKIGQVNLAWPRGKDAKPLFSGAWFDLETAENHRLDIVLGDQGGETTSGLFIQAQDATTAGELTFAPNGNPKIPLVVIGALRDEDRTNLEKYLPPECFKTDLILNGSSASDGQ